MKLNIVEMIVTSVMWPLDTLLTKGKIMATRRSGGSRALRGRWNSVVDAGWKAWAKDACLSTAVW